MEPVTTTSPEADITAQMAQLNLQTNGTLVTPVNGTTGIPITNNNISAPRQRTGIPRYAIPYRRPDEKPAATVAKTNGSSGTKSPAANAATSPAASESAVNDKPATAVSAIPRGRNGFRTDSVGDDSSAIGGGVNSYKGARAASVDPLRGDSGSEHSSVFSSSGQPKRITSKIGSFTNANYKPGGGNVKILDEKVDFSYAQSKCNSKANLKHKPCGGDVQIVDNKLHFKENGRSRINSLANAKHVPGGGNVKIFNEKLPWLKYNKPNLPPEEIAKINKHTPLAPSTSQEPIYSSRHSSTAS
ncbi:unnamed protein product [Hymenolepis diminuta]|uniref:Microtubule-associated protein n=1 Tax=Hymenolepis diminuta TaxID=6216 RepID=A0A564YAM7_HYMDI|nr:unnamed protein product [Hymenolepis diminuta]